MNNTARRVYFVSSFVVYVTTILITILLLLFEPPGFDAKAAFLPVVVILFASALGISQRITQSAAQKAVKYLGTLAVTILFTFMGFFVIAGAGWIIASAKAGEVPPSFAFDEAAATGWRAGEAFNARATVTKDYMGDEPVEKLPVAGRVLFENSSTSSHTCFVMYSYYDYKVDISA